MNSCLLLKCLVLLVAVHYVQAALFWPFCRRKGRSCTSHASCCSDHCGCNNRCSPPWAVGLALPLCSNEWSLVPKPSNLNPQLPATVPQINVPVLANPPISVGNNPGVSTQLANCKGEGEVCLVPEDCCTMNCVYDFDHGVRQIRGQCDEHSQPSISIIIEDFDEEKAPRICEINCG